MFIVPGILVNNIEEFRQQVCFVKNELEWLQIDVVDGKFVEQKNLFLSEIDKDDLEGFSIEVHLMVEEPLNYLEDCLRLGVKRMIVHYEAIHDTPEVLEKIKSHNIQVAVALNPGTTVNYLENVIEYLDGVLLMTVIPGRQGQKFIPEVLEKITEIRTMVPDAIIGIDGGVKLDTIENINKYNLDYAVVGSGLWMADNPSDELKKFKEKL